MKVVTGCKEFDWERADYKRMGEELRLFLLSYARQMWAHTQTKSGDCDCNMHNLGDEVVCEREVWWRRVVRLRDRNPRFGRRLSVTSLYPRDSE